MCPFFVRWTHRMRCQVGIAGMQDLRGKALRRAGFSEEDVADRIAERAAARKVNLVPLAVPASCSYRPRRGFAQLRRG